MTAVRVIAFEGEKREEGGKEAVMSAAGALATALRVRSDTAALTQRDKKRVSVEIERCKQSEAVDWSRYAGTLLPGGAFETAYGTKKCTLQSTSYYN